MSYFYDEKRDRISVGRIVGAAILGLFLTLGVAMAGCPYYNVWASEMNGKAELAQAQFNRQIAVTEAQAKLEAAKMLNLAEVERAKGVAEANHIIGDSLKGNESYLRYLWINGLQTNEQTQVIYVPTEAGLPILEAGKRPVAPTPTPVEK
jgi:regulator of protease activity HflC (stomatin/prohibitin superfamily)